MMYRFARLCLLVSLVQVFGLAAYADQHVLVFGDSGTGDSDQQRVGNAMGSYCKNNRCDFSISVGDNIYEDGVNSVDDPQFQTKFEKPYEALNFPMFMTLGNHDKRAGKEGIQAQIDYTTKSSKWRLPNRYYRFAKGDTEFFALDTTTFETDETQIDWFRAALVGSKAKHKIVFGHHPIYSSGMHMLIDVLEWCKLRRMRNVLEPILCENRVAAYFSGHEHHLEVNQAACGTVHVISGAAAKQRRTIKFLEYLNRHTTKYVQGNVLGFAHARFSDIGM